jgi:hypothetical protein
MTPTTTISAKRYKGNGMKLHAAVFVLSCSISAASSPGGIEDKCAWDAERYGMSGWSLVTKLDLPEDDQILWDLHHRDLHPGVFVANLDAASESCVFSVQKIENGEWLQTIFYARADESEPHVIAGPFLIVSPFVIWKVGPGSYEDRESGRPIVIKNDSIIVEKIESSSIQYFISAGELNSIVAAE